MGHYFVVREKKKTRLEIWVASENPHLCSAEVAVHPHGAESYLRRGHELEALCGYGLGGGLVVGSTIHSQV